MGNTVLNPSHAVSGIESGINFDPSKPNYTQYQAPTAPDTSPTSNAATSDATQTFNTAVAYNQNAQNNLSQVNGAESPVLNSVNSTSLNNLNQYGSTFTPLQQTQAQQAQAWGSNQNASYQAGQAAAGVNSSFDAQRANSAQALASEGVDPASIHGAALDQQSRVAQAAASAGAATQTYQNTKLQGMSDVNAANQLGVQVGQLGTSQATAGSNVGSNMVGNTNQTNAAGINNMTGAVPYLNATTNAQTAGFNMALESEQANAANSDAAMQGYAAGQQGSNALGGIGMMLSGALAEGGPVLSGIPPQPYFAGGPVSKQGALAQSPIPGSTDTKPALLTPDEFVIPKDAATWLGHAHWYKQIDKARQDRAQTIYAHHSGIPPAPAHLAPAAQRG